MPREQVPVRLWLNHRDAAFPTMKFFKKNTELLLRYDDDQSNYSVVFDDNGRVAYAYLLENEDIISDVWLYNVCPTPDQPEWQDRRKMPFANSKEYAATAMVQRAKNESEILFEWQTDGTIRTCGIYLRGELLATLAAGHKPGHGAMAIKDGPLANALYETS